MLRFIQISDTHIGLDRAYRRYDRNTYDHARRMVDYLNNHLDFQPDFVVHTGDVTDLPEDACAELAAEVFADLKYPIYYVIGNHDRAGAMRKYLLKQDPSEDRIFYDFQQGGFHFMVLDTRGEPDPQGFVSADQLAWLAETCQKSTAQGIMLLIHHLPIRLNVPWYDRQMEIVNAAALFEVLQGYKDKIRGVLFGHIHRSFAGFQQGIMCNAVASTFMQFQMSPHHLEPVFDVSAPPEYALVTLTENSTTITYHAIP